MHLLHAIDKAEILLAADSFKLAEYAAKPLSVGFTKRHVHPFTGRMRRLVSLTLNKLVWQVRSQSNIVSFRQVRHRWPPEPQILGAPDGSATRCVALNPARAREELAAAPARHLPRAREPACARRGW